HGNGTYSATFSAATPGLATITGQVNDVIMTTAVQVTVSVGAADPSKSIVETDQTTITTDETATITVRLKDAHGNNLIAGGDAVELDTDYGTLSSVTDHGDGTYSATFSATTPGTADITGKVNGQD